ncbi:twin-arginine translocase subunit TatC [Nonomuraea endophytica]|uniref:Sec-independent protein translocase protein TatC n=1 Tax=Nonomuraea endophytica TaxID=714136 RepID=A0A7W8EJ45_9ACTN|nr:twin-arginine translocase subunit TatC [Nonomuraea endophytica]MBB5081161.1 sec-independent protein translocase protein TatC [Nonomuraea endophytica]
MDHLRELRNRVVISVLALAVTTIVGLIFFDPIWKFMAEPYCSLKISQQLRPECTFAVRGVFESFFVNLKVAALAGVVAASPVWLYQVWRFVTPALYRNEKKYTVTFLAIAVPLFLVGAAFAYLVMDTGLGFLLGFMPDSALPLIEMDEYLSYWVIMLLVFGVSFEVPLLMVFLNIIGVLPRATLAKHRRLIVFLLFVFSAIITPGGDVFTMLALTVPMLVLFALAELVMYIRERRLPATEDYSGLDDDQASPLDTTPADVSADTDLETGPDSR